MLASKIAIVMVGTALAAAHSEISRFTGAGGILRPRSG